MVKPRSALSIVLLLILALLSVLAFPALGLCLLGFDPLYYQQIQLALGWSPSPELARMDNALAAFFQGREPLPADIRDQFQAKEQVHLADLVWLFGELRLFTSFVWVAFLATAVWLFWRDPRWARVTVPWALLGAFLLLAVLGTVITLSFDSLFLQFHRMTFSNDAWILGPDYLIYRLFPPEFFYRSILPYAALVSFLFFLAALVSQVGRRRARPATTPPTETGLPLDPGTASK